jgi:hypothetical protein
LRISKIYFGVVALFFMFSVSAFADEFTSFVQITCSPNIQYFSVRTFSLDNVDTISCVHRNGINDGPPNCKMWDDAEELLKNGIYVADHLPKKPISCSVSGHKILVKLIPLNPKDLGPEVGVNVIVDDVLRQKLYSGSSNNWEQQSLYIFQHYLHSCKEAESAKEECKDVKLF